MNEHAAVVAALQEALSPHRLREGALFERLDAREEHFCRAIDAAREAFNAYADAPDAARLERLRSAVSALATVAEVSRISRGRGR